MNVVGVMVAHPGIYPVDVFRVVQKNKKKVHKDQN